MDIMLICLLLVALMPMISKMPLAYAMHKAGGYNNNYPRKQESELKGFGSRAYGAHQNSHEALLLFAVASFSVIVSHNTSDLMQYLSISFVITRVFYHIFYLLNWASLRSLIWGVGWVICVYMMVGSLI